MKKAFKEQMKKVASTTVGIASATVNSLKKMEEATKCDNADLYKDGNPNPPREKELPPVSLEQQIAQQQLSIAEICDLSKFLVKILLNIPEYINIDTHVTDIGLPIWKNPDGTYTFRLYKKDYSKEFTYCQFVNVLKPYLVQCADRIKFNAQQNINMAWNEYQRKVAQLQVGYNTPYSSLYRNNEYYNTMISQYYQEYLAVQIANYFLLNSLVFRSCEDKGNWVEITVEVKFNTVCHP